MTCRSKVAVPIAAVLLGLFVGRPGRAQSPRGTLVIGVKDERTGAGLQNADVRIDALGLVQSTDADGRARLRPVPPGTHLLDVRRVGYEPVRTRVTLAENDSVELIVRMRQQPPVLPKVLVVDTTPPAHLREFFDRRARGVGQFVSQAQIDSMAGASLDAVLAAHIRGVRVYGDRAQGLHIATRRQSTEHAFQLGGSGGYCPPVVFVDGVQLADGDTLGPNLDIIQPATIAGIEFYSPSEIPPQYRRSGALAMGRRTPTSPACGAVLFWSRP